MEGRVVVGFDGSDVSLEAVRWAVAEAELRNAALDVVLSYGAPPFFDYYGLGLPATPIDRMTIADAAAEQVGLVVAKTRADHPTVRIEGFAADESPIDALVRRADGADLLVVGSNGMGAARSYLLGSVCSGVLVESPCPVAVVSERPHPPQYGRIVVGVDGSTHADEAARWATDEADRRHAELVVLHAWEYPYRLNNEGIGRGSEMAAVDAALVVEHSVAMARDRGSGNVHERLVEGGTVQSLLDASEHADLIVVGSRGRGGFRSMLFGSVAHSVVAHAACTVVVVK